MNFKPTSLKIIVSIIISLITSLYASKMYYIGGSGPSYVFSTSSVIGFFIPLILIYLIWSLIQKK